jgi:predicted nuclease with RNAse H fold
VTETAAVRWYAGVDVGGRRKGFHCALVDGTGDVALARHPTPDDVVDWLAAQRSALVAVDGPLAPAPPGERSRRCERQLVAARICGIRYTPDRARLDASPAYYEWIEHGFELYAALAAAELAVIECFPTASWSRWFGPRGDRGRAAWTTRALAAHELRRLPARMNQDERDAVGAALTARAHARGETERYGDIVVPKLSRRRRRTARRRPSSLREPRARHASPQTPA